MNKSFSIFLCLIFLLSSVFATITPSSQDIFWNFDETTGSTLYDSLFSYEISGGHYDLTKIHYNDLTSTNLSIDQNGLNGRSVLTTNPKVLLSSPPYLFNSGFSGWVKSTGDGMLFRVPMIYEKASVFLWASSNTLEFVFEENSIGPSWSSGAVNVSDLQNEWAFFSIMHNSTGQKFCWRINNTHGCSGDFEIPIVGPPGVGDNIPFTIGTTVNGYFDELYVTFNRNLSQSDLNFLYNDGNGFSGSFQPTLTADNDVCINKYEALFTCDSFVNNNCQNLRFKMYDDSNFWDYTYLISEVNEFVAPDYNTYFISLEEDVWIKYFALDNMGIASSVYEKTFTIPLSGGETTTTISGCSGGWNVENQIITLDCSAPDCGGCDVTRYRLNDGNWIIYVSPFVLSEDLNYKIEYDSNNSYGNWEATNTSYCAIDKTNPILHNFSPTDGSTGIYSNIISFDYNELYPTNNIIININGGASDFNQTAHCSNITDILYRCTWTETKLITNHVNYYDINFYNDLNQHATRRIFFEYLTTGTGGGGSNPPSGTKSFTITPDSNVFNYFYNVGQSFYKEFIIKNTGEVPLDIQVILGINKSEDYEFYTDFDGKVDVNREKVVRINFLFKRAIDVNDVLLNFTDGTNNVNKVINFRVADLKSSFQEVVEVLNFDLGDGFLLGYLFLIICGLFAFLGLFFLKGGEQLFSLVVGFGGLLVLVFFMFL